MKVIHAFSEGCTPLKREVLVWSKDQLCMWNLKCPQYRTTYVKVCELFVVNILNLVPYS